MNNDINKFQIYFGFLIICKKKKPKKTKHTQVSWYQFKYLTDLSIFSRSYTKMIIKLIFMYILGKKYSCLFFFCPFGILFERCVFPSDWQWTFIQTRENLSEFIRMIHLCENLLTRIHCVMGVRQKQKATRSKCIEKLLNSYKNIMQKGV